jgi:hypothetical protein
LSGAALNGIRQAVDFSGSGFGGGGSGGNAAGKDASAVRKTAGGHCLSGEKYAGVFSAGDFDSAERGADGFAVCGGTVEKVTELFSYREIEITKA